MKISLHPKAYRSIKKQNGFFIYFSLSPLEKVQGWKERGRGGEGAQIFQIEVCKRDPSKPKPVSLKAMPDAVGFREFSHI